MKLRRLSYVLLLLSVFLAGCFSSSSSRVVDDQVQLVTDVDTLDPRGPQIQQVVISAYSSSGKPITADDLLIQGVTADGRLVEVSGVKAEDRSVQSTSAEGRSEIVLTINLQELLAQGIVRIQISLQTDPLRFVIIAILPEEPGNPDEPGEPGDPDDPGEPGDPGQEPGDPQPGDPGDPDEPGEPGDPDEPGDPGNGDPGEPGDPGDGDQEEPGDSGEEPGLPGPDPGPEPPLQTVEIRTLRAGTSQATEAYIIRSVNPGPAVVVVGGMHGSETAGWMAAGEIKDWQIDAGTLVVIPEANRPAILRNRRTGEDDVDLNRQFPVGSQPKTALAREIWDLVLEFQPVALMDLHEGWGIRRDGDRFSDGTLSVGQTIIAYDARDARTFAASVIKYLDKYHIRSVAQPRYSFMLIGPPVAGSLARKAGAELGIPAFIVEPTQKNTYLTTRIRWHKVWVEELLKWYGLINRDRQIVPKEYNASALAIPGMSPLGIAA